MTNNFIKQYWFTDTILPRLDLTFECLSDCILYIEEFHQEAASVGTVFQDKHPIMSYEVDKFGFITWKTDDNWLA